jgi:WXG100 family type VII secretion target
MAVIQITPESIRAQAQTVLKYKSAHEQVIAQMRKLVLSFNESWKGEAQDAFVAKFQSMDSVYRKFAEVLEAYAKLMDTAATELQQEDQRLQTMIQRIG